MTVLYVLRLGYIGPGGYLPWQEMDAFRRQSPSGAEQHLANELRDPWRVPRPYDDVELHATGSLWGLA
eukprot:3343595-Lingulodinium_polyedra.AAC.1